MTRATELTTIFYVTHEGVDAREAVFTVIREPKSDSTLNKGADTGRGRGRKRTEEETTKKVNNKKGINNTGITGGKRGSIVKGFRKTRTNFLARCHASSPG
jgi:hypothetical protein